MKKSAFLITTIILLITIVVFTLQNTILIRVDILFWNIETSLALLIFSTFSVGALGAIIFLIPTIFNLRRQITESENKNNQLIEKEKDRTRFNKNSPA